MAEICLCRFQTWNSTHSAVFSWTHLLHVKGVVSGTATRAALCCRYSKRQHHISLVIPSLPDFPVSLRLSVDLLRIL